MVKPLKSTPAEARRTPEMHAMFDRMVFTQSVAVVRVGSQWWAAENDFPITGVPVSAAMQAVVPRKDRDRLLYDKPVFNTATVNAMVDRGVLKFVGRRVKAPASNRAGTMTYERAQFRR